MPTPDDEQASEGLRPGSITRRALAFALAAGSFLGLGGLFGRRPALAAAASIGKVSRMQGGCHGTNEGKTRTLALGNPIFADEVIATAKDARLELTFVDNTKLTLGERAEVKLDTYVFDQRGTIGRLQFAASGPFRFISGRLSKAADADVRIETPVATLGIRGTEFWGGPLDGQYSVFLIEGAVSVVNAAGLALLQQPGTGVDVPAPGRAPGPVTVWPRNKVARALATVTFR